jgi:hypothetical protein
MAKPMGGFGCHLLGKNTVEWRAMQQELPAGAHLFVEVYPGERAGLRRIERMREDPRPMRSV